MKNQILCTFAKKQKLEDVVDNIVRCYDLIFNKIYCLSDIDNLDDLILTYNVVPNSYDRDNVPKNTIAIHRKKETNTLYTIDALNSVIYFLNDGVVDNTYPMPWDSYKNSLLLGNVENGFKRIKTKIYKIIEIN